MKRKMYFLIAVSDGFRGLLLCLLTVLSGVCIAEAQQDKTSRKATGVVSDLYGAALPDVAVVIKSARVGTTTDAQGRFELVVPESVTETEPTLVFSYVGMTTQEVVFRGKPLSVTLVGEEMSALVVTGVFNKPKESYTGAALTLTRRELEAAGHRSVLSAIRNIDPSFNLVENIRVGSNPNVLPSITMRGASSLPSSITDIQTDVGNTGAANLPLVILDGFEISLTRFIDMDENQIESITLLKDASATAVYGTRASNGVLVVSSRRPAEGRLRFTYTGSLDVEAPDLSSYNLMSSLEKLAYEKAAGMYDSPNMLYDRDLKDVYSRRKIEAERGVDTWWLKYPVRAGVGSHHSVSVEGGDKTLRYGAGLGYRNIHGAMKGSNRDSFNGNMFLQYISGQLLFYNDLEVAYNKSNESPYGSFADYTYVNPYYKPYDDSGNLQKIVENLYYPNNGQTVLKYNPLYNALLPSVNSSQYLNIRNSFAAEWRVRPEFTVRGQFGVTANRDRSDLYISADNTVFDSYVDDDFARKGSYTLGTGASLRYDLQLTLNYSATFAERHRLSLFGSWTMYEDRWDSYSVTGEGISVADMDFLGMASKYAKNGRPYGAEGVTRNAGASLNANYIYSHRYFVDISGKYEGSSQFGAHSRYAPMGTVGLGWNLHNETFMRRLSFINTARLRLSYGITGNQKFSPYQALTTYHDFGGRHYRNWYGVYLMALGNPELGWSLSRQFNVGAEAVFGNNRFRLNFDFYKKTTDNLLTDINLPPAAGFATYKANVGAVENTGFELSFNAFVVRNYASQFTWSVGGALMHNRNIIRRISNSLQTLNEELMKQGGRNPSFLYREGESINTLFAVRSKGIDPGSGREIYVKADGSETFVWDAADQVACGVTDPAFNGTFNTALRYRGFTLAVYFLYRVGGQDFNYTLSSKVENIDPNGNLDKRALYERWKTPGDLSKFKSVKDRSTTNNTTRFVGDNNLFQLPSITLGYIVPEKTARHIFGVQYLELRGALEDLLYCSTLEREIGLNYPFSRKYSLSLKFRF